MPQAMGTQAHELGTAAERLKSDEFAHRRRPLWAEPLFLAASDYNLPPSAAKLAPPEKAPDPGPTPRRAAPSEAVAVDQAASSPVGPAMSPPREIVDNAARQGRKKKRKIARGL